VQQSGKKAELLKTVAALLLTFPVVLSCATKPEGQPRIDLGGLSPREGWVRINASPYRISPEVSALCVQLPPKTSRQSRRENPHDQAFVTVFVNAIGAEAMRADYPKFPEGSIIVKQKYYSTVAPASPAGADLYTVMIKRGVGYNSAMSDWEFAVLAGDGRRVEARGPLATCMACHQERATTDYVYGTYRTQASR
jgi:hypothetical protein